MAMRVVYTVLDAEILSETRSGVEYDYLPDPLGSTVALLDATQTKSSQWQYWPYGEVRVQVGASTTPFTFVGTLGYYSDNTVRIYVRNRMYRTENTRWMSLDAFWPAQPPYTYAASTPTVRVDPSGMACFNVDKDCAKWGGMWVDVDANATKQCARFVKCWHDSKCWSDLIATFAGLGCKNAATLADCMRMKCDGTHCVDIWCSKWGCNDCDKDEETCATTKQGSWYSNCGIRICPDMGTPGCDWDDKFLHEISHCCGTDDEGPCNAYDIGNKSNEVLKRYHY